MSKFFLCVVAILYTTLLFSTNYKNLETSEDQPEKVKHMSPGKVDLLVKSNENSTDYNFILWSPIVKGGFGFIDVPGSSYTLYGGAHIRPLQFLKDNGNDKGELILGFNAAKHNGTTPNPKFDGTYVEAQAEYRFKFGLCLGGGYVDSKFFEAPPSAIPGRTNDYFAKVSYRKNFAKSWHVTITGLMQQVDDKIWPGGYAAIYGKPGSLAGGYDGESWRASVGWICKKNDALLKPALEVLYIDKTIGDNTAAPTILWINGTFKFKGGFLSNAARLGRAMGPTGLEFGNPLGFLYPINDGNPIFKVLGNPSPPIWNRALNPWELGGLITLRLFHLKLPNDAIWGKAQVEIFPFQFWTAKRNFLDNIFVGANYFYFAKTPNGSDVKAPGVEAGFVQRIKTLQANFEVEYDTKNKKITVQAGIINWF